MDHLTIHCRLKKIVLSMIYLAILKAEGKKYINCKHFYCGYMKMCRALIINSCFLNFITTFCWFYWIRFTCDVRGENRIYCFLWTARNLTFYMQFWIKVLNFVKSFIENLWSPLLHHIFQKALEWDFSPRGRHVQGREVSLLSREVSSEDIWIKHIHSFPFLLESPVDYFLNRTNVQLNFFFSCWEFFFWCGKIHSTLANLISIFKHILVSMVISKY